MSLFQNRDIDNILLLLFNFSDLKKMISVNKYYHNEINKNICYDNWRDVHKNYNTVKMNDVGDRMFCYAIKKHYLWILKILISKYSINLRCDIFLDVACENGCLDIVKWLVEDLYININNPNSCDKRYAKLFSNASEHGHLDIMKYIFNMCPNISECWWGESHPFHIACKKNYMPIIKWFCESCIEKKKYIYADGFVSMCENENFDDIMWLYNFLKDNNIEIPINAFYAVCKKGLIDLLKIFVKNGDVDLDKNDYGTYRYCCFTQKFIALRYACSNGHLNIVKYLWHPNDNNKIGILFKDTFYSRKYDVSRWIYTLVESSEIEKFSEQIYKEILRMVCRNGDLNETVWIYNICMDLGISISNAEYFKNVCHGNNKDLIIWFYDKDIDFTLCDINYWRDIFTDVFHGYLYNTYDMLNSLERNLFRSFELDLSRIFSYLCCDGSLKKITYLMNAVYTCNIKIKVDIHVDDEYPFRVACAKGNLELAKYILSFDEVDVHTQRNFAFNYSYGNGHYDVADWLLENFQIPNKFVHRYLNKKMKKSQGYVKI